jgi:hypothetical protein
MRITRGQLRRIVKEEATRLREVRGDEGSSTRPTDRISSATAHKILDLAQEAAELAAESGIDYGDPYDATMRQLQDFLATITV